MIQDFTRIIPKQGYEEWPNKLSKISELFLRTEEQMVKKKYRAAAIVDVSVDNFQSFLDRINKNGLMFTPIRKRAISSGFSALTKSVEPGQPFVWQGCLTRNYKDGQKFKEADLKNDHRTIGQMLGYPECCIDFFINNFPIDPCPIWVGLEGKVRGFPECNGILRYFGPRITAHLSCSPTCQATKEVGKIWFKVMQEINKELAQELYNLLNGSVIWNSYHGVVQVETPYFVGLNNSFYLLKKPRIINWEGKKETQKKEKINKKGEKNKLKRSKNKN